MSWHSGNQRIADVSDGIATGIRSGRVNIIARTGRRVARANLRVVDVTSLSIEPDSGIIDVGRSLQLMAFATFGTNTQLTSVTDDATWESRGLSIATVSNTGFIIGIGAGQVEIRATLGDKTATAVFTVNAPPLAKDDQATTPTDTTVTLSVTDNDSDSDGTIVPATVDLNPSTPGRQTMFNAGQGMFVADDLGNVTFSPQTGFIGIAATLYTVEDDRGSSSDTATIAVTVTDSNIPPMAIDDIATTQLNTPVSLLVTDNDSDLDGTINVASVDLDPSTPARDTTLTASGEGRFIVDNVGNVTFTPVSSFVGASNILYTVQDNDGATSNQANITITVTPVDPGNNPPVAVDDLATTTLQQPVTIPVLTNDSDPDNDPLTVVDVTQPASGTVIINPDNTLTYTSALNTRGQVVFPYTISDGRGGMASAAVTVAIVNTPPLAVDDQAMTRQDTEVTFSVTSNDSDLDGTIDPTTLDLDPAVSARQTALIVLGEGQFVADDLGNVTFTPAPSFTGDSTILYTIADDQGLLSNAASITVTVTSRPNAVLGVAKMASVSGNQVTLSLYIENSGDVALSNLRLFDDLDATFGAGNYTVGSPSLSTAPTTSVIVLNSEYTGAAGAGAELFDVANSTLALGEFAVIALPVRVTNLTDQGNGLGVYTNTAVGSGDPPSGAQDRVTDESTDGSEPDPDNDGNPNEMIPTPIVLTQNQPPIAVADQAVTPFNTPISFSVTDNDSDSDGMIDIASVDLDPNTPMRNTSLNVPGEGRFIVDNVGNVTFTPEPTFNGTATIVYTVKDNDGATSNRANISVTVAPLPNNPPVAVDDLATTFVNMLVTFSATANDTDSDGTIDTGSVDLDPNTAEQDVVFNVLNEGQFSVDSEGDVTFTPETGFIGSSTITYSVQDNDGATSNLANLVVTVTAGPNNPPVAVDDRVTTPQATPVTFLVTANDSDADGTINPVTVDLDALTPGRQTTFSVVGQGQFDADDMGNVTFIPDSGFIGVSTILYTVQDNDGATSNEAIIIVTVTGVLVADAGLDQTVFVEQIVALDGSGSLPDGAIFSWKIVEQPDGSNAALSSTSDVMPTFAADQSGSYRVELIVANDLDISEPDTVIITAVVPAVFAQGVGLDDEGAGLIAFNLPSVPVRAYLTWQTKDGRTDNRIRLNNGQAEILIEGEVSTDPERGSILCFYADVTQYVLAAPPGLIEYTVTHAQPIPGAGMIIVASDLVADIMEFGRAGAGERLSTIARLTLGANLDPRRRIIEIKAGCDFFFHNSSDPVTFDFESSPGDRAAKVTLLVGDAQSEDVPRRSEIVFTSPSSPVSLGKDETGLIANDGCYWDTFGRNSGVQPPALGCYESLFPQVGDPDRRGEVIVPGDAASARVQLRSPSPQSSSEKKGVSGILTFAVFELVAPVSE